MAKKARVWDGANWQELATAQTDLTNYANLTTTPISGFRNAIINGGFDIWQRGTSTFTAAGYTADRWRIQNASGQTISLTQQVFTPGNAITGYEPTNFLRFSLSGTPSGTYWLAQRVEDVRTFAGQTVTISFWAKASSATTALVPALEQNFGSGGSSVVTTTGSALSLTTSWQRFSQTFSVPSISGKTIGTSSFLEVRPFYGSTAITGNNIDIWGVQVEPGSVATPFEQRPIGTELALCQRYYWRVSGETAPYVGLCLALAAGGTTVRRLTVPLPVTMRIKPTVTKAGTHSLLTAGLSNRLFNTISGNNSSPNMISLDVTTTNTTTSGEVLMYIIDTASANDYLDASAEL
jgi:hypothetical protein